MSIEITFRRKKRVESGLSLKTVYYLMLPFQKSITREEVNTLPLRSFDGEIKLINTLDKVHEAVEYLKQQPVLGFDTETRPSFKKMHSNGVALLQLATANRTFLFRVNKIGVPDALTSILSNSRIIKIGVAIKDDIQGLQGINSFKAGGFVELQNYVSNFGIESLSLKKLSAIVLKFRISKRQQVSNWESEELSVAQMRYAATDAWIALKIYQKLEEYRNH